MESWERDGVRVEEDSERETDEERGTVLLIEATLAN